MSSERTSKIRALALASRCLAREIRRLKEAPDARKRRAADEDSEIEVERLVHLARTILDPTYAPEPSLAALLDPYPSKPGARNGRDPKAAGTSFHDLFSEGPPSSKHSLSLFGQGTLIPIPELVGFLGTIGVNGILKVRTQVEMFTVEFNTGHIVHGEASRAPRGQRLGDLLVSQGSIDRVTLEETYAEGSTWRLGRRLLEDRLITREQLVQALRAQIQMLFCRLFREQAKSYSFWSGPPQCGEEGVRLNSTSLLLEGARVNDEVQDGLRTIGGTRLEGRG